MRSARFTALLVLCLGFAGAPAEEFGVDVADVQGGPLHGDGVAFERAALEATRGFLRDDAKAARAALDLLWRDSRDTVPEEDAVWGSDVVGYSKAFRTTISRARESLARGDVESGFIEFVFVQKTCRFCHAAKAKSEGAQPSSR
jgi:hypothetical protein